MPNLFDFGLVWSQIPVTLEIALISMAASLVIGLGVALVKIRKVPVLAPLATFYVSFMRGTPVLVQLYLTFYAIPMALQYANFAWGTHWNINDVPPLAFVLLTFALNEGAYNSETIRAALQAVDRGQVEAASSLGMTSWQTFRRIVFPEALIVALPNLGNSFISLIKATSLAFVCSVVEMTAAGKLLASRNFRFFEVYVSLALVYWAVTVGLEALLAWGEKKLRANDQENESGGEPVVTRRRSSQKLW